MHRENPKAGGAGCCPAGKVGVCPPLGLAVTPRETRVVLLQLPEGVPGVTCFPGELLAGLLEAIALLNDLLAQCFLFRPLT